MPDQPLPINHDYDDPDDYCGAHGTPKAMIEQIKAEYRAATVNKLLYNEGEVAVILGCSVNMLKAWQRTGEGPPWVMLDNRWIRYPLSGLRRFVAGLKQETVYVPGARAQARKQQKAAA
jgi:hypothetical protein